MPLEAETVAVDVRANLQGFTPKVSAAASSFGRDMQKMEADATKMEGGVARSTTRAGASIRQLQNNSRILGQQFSDIGAQLASGTSPFLILAQQGSQVANAMDGAKGRVGQFASFLSGPWGAALLAGTSLLAVMIGKLIQTGDSVDDLVEKLKKDAEEQRKADAAHAAYSRTLEGQIALQKKLADALDDSWKSQRQLNAEQLRGVAINLDNLRQGVRDKQAELAKAEQVRDRAVEQLTRRPVGGIEGEESGLGIAAQQAQAAVTRIKKEIADGQNAIAASITSLRQANLPILQDQVADAMDGTAASIGKLSNQLDDVNAAYVAGRISAAAFTEQSAKLRKEIEKLEETRTKRTKAASLPQVTGAEIAKALGTTITSGKRTAAENKAADGAVNSYHLIGQAIDIPLTVNGKPLTKAGIRAALEPLGVEIKELLGPGDKGHADHFHIAFDKKRRAPDQVNTAIVKAQAEADKLEAAEIDRKRRIYAEGAGLDEQILRQRQEIADSAAEEARLEIQSIDAAQKKYNADLDALVKKREQGDHTDGLTAIEAAIFKLQRGKLADLEREAVKRLEARRVREENLQLATGLIDVDVELLQSQQDVAKTQKERRRIALEIVAAEHEKLKIALQDIINSGTANEAQKEIARKRLANLKTLEANAAQGAAERTAGPLESYFTGIRKTGEDLNTAFEEIAAGGLASVVDGLGAAAAGMTTLGDVGRQVLAQLTAALVKLAIQQLLLKTLGDTVGQTAETAGQAATAGASAATAQTVAQAAAAAAAWAPAAAAASLATLGANAGPAIGALIATNAVALALAAAGAALGSVAGHAEGGLITGPGTGTSDSILRRVSNGEFIVRKAAVDAIGLQNLDFINRNGDLPGFADGGAVGQSTGGASSTAGAVIAHAAALMNAIPIIDDFTGAVRKAGDTVGGKKSLGDRLLDAGAEYSPLIGAAKALFGHAGGGLVSGSGTGTSDSIPAMLSNGEFVLRRGAVDAIGLRNLEAINAAGAIPAMSSVNVAAASAGGGGGRVTMDQEFRREMRAMIGEAVMAVPDVNLYPTFDADAALQKALSSPAGSRNMLAYINANAGKISAALGHGRRR